jgi:hypothetical protein
LAAGAGAPAELKKVTDLNVDEVNPLQCSQCGGKMKMSLST